MSAENITISAGTQILGAQGAQDTITLSCADTIDLTMLNHMATASTANPYTVNTGALGGFTAGTGWTTTNANTSATPWFTQTPSSAKITLNGEGADIVVNGASLVDAINSIKDRLNCLQINPQLEAEWDQLRALGDQYRELEQEILAKQATWDRLKAMPKIDID